jgi:heme oxygenase
LTGKSDQKIDEELKAIAQNGKLAKFIAHTKQSVENNPHVLVAYAWVLYMALFSGGRYLRAALKAAGGLGKDFWDREPSPVRPYIITRDVQELKDSEAEFAKPTGVWSPQIAGRGRGKSRSDSDIPKITPGLLFFEFIGDDDGEDIKIEFKRRITEAELLLTKGEKDDIVAEAQDIFSFMLDLVGELDDLMKMNEEDLEMSKLFLQSPNLMTSRDSVTIAQERLSRKTSNAPEEEVRTRKSSYLDAIFEGPVAKFIAFNESSPRVSFERDAKLKDTGYFNRLWIQSHTVVLPILATLALFLVWYVGA